MSLQSKHAGSHEVRKYSWGTGIHRIQELAKEYNLPAPEFIDLPESFQVNLYRHQLPADGSNMFAENTIKIAENINVTAQNGKLNEANGANPDANDANLNSDLAVRIISIIQEQPDISQSEIAERLALSRRTVQRAMSALKGIGRIERIGNTRGYWKIL